ncbi:MAG TPA: DNA mismatch repair protein MutS [Candidatus Bathyarchaeia archaeon]|nr:DNA mismatch repair protein MutS [Candidatus Bathyarchaeia archaeon]
MFDTTKAHTPLMQQYATIKMDYLDMLLLFQVGDFYEFFYEDAQKASRCLGIALTARGTNNGEPIPLCGVPVHALDHYVPKLIKAGFKVALCQQLEEPKPGTVVRRGVTRVLTPGTLTDAQLLDEKSASYVCSLFPGPDRWGIIFAELLTAQLSATSIPAENHKMLEAELIRFFPDEILIPALYAKTTQPLFSKMGYYTTVIDAQVQDHAFTNAVHEWLQVQFMQQVQEHLAAHQPIRTALYYFYAYMNKHQRAALSQFHAIQFYRAEDFLLLDLATQRNLELVKNSRDGGHEHTLFSILDRAVTPMGSRMIKKWILRPLIDHEAICQRHEVVKAFVADGAYTHHIFQQLHGIGDLERIVGRIALSRAQLHDFRALKKALGMLPELTRLLDQLLHVPLIATIRAHVPVCQELFSLLDASLNEDADRDWIIKQGFDNALDTMRDFALHAHQKIVDLERAEQEKTGIASLKIRYNQVQGHYIEITKANIHLVPCHYKRQQTLVGKERFSVAALDELAYTIERASHECGEREKELFEQIKVRIHVQVNMLRKIAHGIAYLDALRSLADVAYTNRYVCPVLEQKSGIIHISKGRHPVVEWALEGRFIANDTHLDDAQVVWIITGPNMGGKSTYLRQVALIAIMAHIGSFVPAHAATISILDRIFTRIGAHDHVAEGKSTFLVEMEETASICTYATEKSLVILDEVGRGTSTFDGLAIAQAVLEYIHDTVRARCLFATHYHELTKLEKEHATIVAYHAVSKKTENGILFLYTIMPGVAHGSFGIEVAKLAQLPHAVIMRAQALMQVFNNEEIV